MQHVIYYGLSGEQLTDMAAKDEPTSYVLGMKQGQGVEIDGIMISPAAYTGEPLKDEGVDLKPVTPIKGRMPETEKEMMWIMSGRPQIPYRFF